MQTRSATPPFHRRIVPAVQIGLWLAALTGYFGAWVTRQPHSAALSWNAYELFNLLRFLPEIETGAVSANLHTFRLPLLGLALILPLLVQGLSIHEKARAYVQISVTLLSGLLCVMTLPPYPEILTAWKTPGWRVVFWWAVITGIAVLTLTWSRSYQSHICRLLIIGVLVLTGIPALITRQRLDPTLMNLHQTPVQWGKGLWLWAICMGLILLIQWVMLFRDTDAA